MITAIHLDGFRHFRNTSISLRSPYTLICGLNGTGKTTVIELLNRLQLFLINGLPINSLCSWLDIPAWEVVEYGSYKSSIGFEMKKDDFTYSYSLVIKTNFRDFLARVEKESLAVNDHLIFESNTGEATVHSDDDRTFMYPVDWSSTGLSVAERNSSKIKNFLRDVKDNIFSLSINPYNIPATHQKEDYQPVLQFDASNFSAWYHVLIGRKLSTVAQAFNEMRYFIPGFQQFIVSPEGKSRELSADISMDGNRKYHLSFDALSHGQKILSILHLLVRIAPAHSTIAIDELENFLALTELQPLYNAFQDAYEDRNIQFIIVSHHPKTLSWFTDSAVVLSCAENPPIVQAFGVDETMKQSLVDFLREGE